MTPKIIEIWGRMNDQVWDEVLTAAGKGVWLVMDHLAVNPETNDLTPAAELIQLEVEKQVGAELGEEDEIESF